MLQSMRCGVVVNNCAFFFLPVKSGDAATGASGAPACNTGMNKAYEMGTSGSAMWCSLITHLKIKKDIMKTE